MKFPESSSESEVEEDEVIFAKEKILMIQGMKAMCILKAQLTNVWSVIQSLLELKSRGQ